MTNQIHQQVNFYYQLFSRNQKLINPNSPILACHSVAEVSPETGVARNQQLIGLRGNLFALQRVDHMWIVEAEHNRIVNLTKCIKFFVI